MLGFSAIGKLALGQFPRRAVAVQPDPDPPPAGSVDAAKVTASRVVVFAGGIRTVVFTGGTRTVRF